MASNPPGLDLLVGTPPIRMQLRVRVLEDAPVAASWAYRIATETLGFPSRSGHEVALAVSELATNQARHAGGGQIEVSGVDGIVEIVARDDGPGLPDAKDTKLEPRSCLRAGLGVGLSAVRRLMDEVEVQNEPNGGLRVSAVKTRSPRAGTAHGGRGIPGQLSRR